ncbi:hypothetical protein H0B56_12060 [Haloechinothrix sp. YIM 98757]|uniref:Uncharacterized protein n=1 Tax=Haloechinothrix aidingensis TaxID=2752311 RepID=A0A838AAN2_9PSEU|nr:hypothetical protein [Haloechinothrix aidingensis]MBA0126276.1 hypothetical protein [Haloechinothrix aidingensis]
MPWQAGQRITAAHLPQEIGEARNDGTVDTNDTDVELVALDVHLEADTAYRIEGFSRARWLDSADNNGQAHNEIRVDTTPVAVSRNRPESTSTARTCSLYTVEPHFVPESTGTVTVQLMGSRTSMSGTTSDIQFRGSGGTEFEMWLRVSVMSPA